MTFFTTTLGASMLLFALSAPPAPAEALPSSSPISPAPTAVRGASAPAAPTVAIKLPPVDPTVPVSQGEASSVLARLRGTQTETEITTIMNSPGPSIGLVDRDTRALVAAVRLRPGPRVPEARGSPWLLQPTGPGCATTDVCLTVRTAPRTFLGFHGRGALDGRWVNVGTIFAGDARTTFVTNMGTWDLDPGKQLEFDNTVTVIQLHR